MEKEIKLNFQSSKSDADNLLVCLHGNSTDSNYFSVLLEGIEGWKVVAPDYIGHGQSPKLEKTEYNYEVFIQCLVDFINQFSYNKLVILGHSMGGNLALELIPELKIDGVLLLAAPPVSYTSDLAPYLKLPDFVLTDNHKENKVCVEKYLSEVTSDQDAIAYLTQTFLDTDPAFRDRLLEEFGAMKFSDELEILKKNNYTYIGCIMSIEDVGANNEYLNQLNKDNIFDFYDKIPDSGHYSLLEKPNENNTSILKFLENLS